MLYSYILMDRQGLSDIWGNPLIWNTEIKGNRVTQKGERDNVENKKILRKKSYNIPEKKEKIWQPRN